MVIQAEVLIQNTCNEIGSEKDIYESQESTAVDEKIRLTGQDTKKESLQKYYEENTRTQNSMQYLES